MAKYDKKFFLARKLIGDDPYRATHSIALAPKDPWLLAVRTFGKGTGADFRNFLLGPVATGERMPRPLPKAVGNAVARFANDYRRGKDDRQIAFNVLLTGEGERQLTWSLERGVSRKAYRYDPLKVDPSIRQAREQHKHVVLKSELDTLQIRQWHRDLHYRVHLTAFQNANDVERWKGLNQVPAQPLAGRVSTRAPGHRNRPTRSEEALWFEQDGWQELPAEVVRNMSKDAKKLVFPTRSWPRAVDRASGGLLLALFVTGFYELSKQDPPGRPANHVWTKYRAHINVDFAEASLPP